MKGTPHIFSAPIAGHPYVFQGLQAQAFKLNICIDRKDFSNSLEVADHVFSQLSYARQSMKDVAPWHLHSIL